MTRPGGGPDDQALGRSRGGFGTKGHAAVTGLGLPRRLILTPGRRQDVTQADAPLDGLAPAVIADRGYDSRALVERIEAAGAGGGHPDPEGPEGAAAIDREGYEDRNLAERFWAKARQYRRVATRYDKTAANFAGSVWLAAVRDELG